MKIIGSFMDKRARCVGERCSLEPAWAPEKKQWIRSNCWGVEEKKKESQFNHLSATSRATLTISWNFKHIERTCCSTEWQSAPPQFQWLNWLFSSRLVSSQLGIWEMDFSSRKSAFFGEKSANLAGKFLWANFNLTRRVISGNTKILTLSQKNFRFFRRAQKVKIWRCAHGKKWK